MDFILFFYHFIQLILYIPDLEAEGLACGPFVNLGDERYSAIPATFSGDLSLTKKWKLSLTSGYDFTSKKLTLTSINIYRDLHCWEMHFNWIPFGFRQSFSLDINVKSSTLKDLKLSRRKDWYDYK